MGIFGALIAGGGVIVAGGIAWARQNLTEKGTVVRLLRREPTTPIAELIDLTRAKVVGVVKAHEDSLLLPFVGKPCLAYALTVHQRATVKVLDPYLPVLVEARGVSFLVEDDTGIARCEGRIEAHAWRQVHFEPGKAELEAFLRSHRLDPELSTQVELTAMFVGDRVAVHGLVTFESTTRAAANGFRGAMQRPVLGPNRSTGLTLSNHPRATRVRLV